MELYINNIFVNPEVHDKQVLLEMNELDQKGQKVLEYLGQELAIAAGTNNADSETSLREARWLQQPFCYPWDDMKTVDYFNNPDKYSSG